MGEAVVSAGGRVTEAVKVAPWPGEADQARIDSTLESTMELVQSAIATVRRIRGEHDVSPGEKTDLIVAVADVARRDLLDLLAHRA